MDMTSTLISSTMMSTMQSKKNCWWCLRVFASLVFRNSLKTSFVFWWKYTRPCMEIMKMFQKHWDNLYPESHLTDVTFVVVWTSSWQMKTRVSINHQWIELQLLCQCAYLCMEQYAWINAISSKMHAEWFFYPSNCQIHILDRTTWFDKTTPYLWNSNYLGLWIKSCKLT